jgi:hypothetical protein
MDAQQQGRIRERRTGYEDDGKEGAWGVEGEQRA